MSSKNYNFKGLTTLPTIGIILVGMVVGSGLFYFLYLVFGKSWWLFVLIKLVFVLTLLAVFEIGKIWFSKSTTLSIYGDGVHVQESSKIEGDQQKTRFIPWSNISSWSVENQHLNADVYTAPQIYFKLKNGEKVYYSIMNPDFSIEELTNHLQQATDRYNAGFPANERIRYSTTQKRPIWVNYMLIVLLSVPFLPLPYLISHKMMFSDTVSYQFIIICGVFYLVLIALIINLIFGTIKRKREEEESLG